MITRAGYANRSMHKRNKVNKFFVLEIATYTQYRFAWYDIWGEAKYLSPAPTCPNCGGFIGSLSGWDNPKLVLKQPRLVGDFVGGAGGCDFLISERFLNDYKKAKFRGFELVFPVTVIRMGTTKKAKAYPLPKLFGVNLIHTMTQVDFGRMGVGWFSRPQKGYCRVCGPGHGGRNGVWNSISRVVVMDKTWTGEDIFFAINLPGIILLSSNAANMILQNCYTNAEVIPCENYRYSFGTIEQPAPADR